MYLYQLNQEKIISPFVLKKGLFHNQSKMIDRAILEFKCEIQKCKIYRIQIENNRLLSYEILEQIEIPKKENEYILIEDYRSFVLYTVNDRYEYCSYCDLIANKVMDNCHICHRKKCGSCENFEEICNYCDTNIII